MTAVPTRRSKILLSTGHVSAVASAGSFIITTVREQNPGHTTRAPQVGLSGQYAASRPSQKQGKEHGRAQGAASRRRTTGLGNTDLQARTRAPSRAKRRARTGNGSGRARASHRLRRPRGPRPAERGGRAVAPPGTPAVGAQRASPAGSEELEAATNVGRRRDAPRPVHRASQSWRWRGAVDNLP